MPKKFTSKTQRIGKTGEDIAVRFLVKQGFKVLEQNVTHGYSEIDIVAKKGDQLHFVEVKTGRRDASIRPEENMTTQKLTRLRRGVEQYLYEHGSCAFQIDLIAVVLKESGEVDVMYVPQVL